MNEPCAAPERMRVGADFRMLLDLAPEAVFLARRSGRLAYVNEAACVLSAWSRGELLAMPIESLFAPGWPGTGARPANPFETELLRADGTWLAVEADARTLPGGSVQAWVRDISRRKPLQAQAQALAASERLLHTVFDLLPVGLWIADREGRITHANAAAEHIWSGSGFVGARHDLFFKAWRVETGEEIVDQEWGLARALRGEASQGELVRIQCFDGSTKTVLNWATPIRSADGDIVGAIAANEDVTSLQYTQEQLRAAVRERERILAVVAHDLRNPLSALMAHAATTQLLAAKLPGAGKVAAQAASMLDITRQMSGLVNDLLSVGAAGAGGHHLLTLSKVNPAALMIRAADAIEPLMADRQIKLSVLPHHRLPALDADADRILRVLGNLLDNALKFTPAHGRVSVCAKPTSAGIMFCVGNSGPPVPAAELGAMFQPFWQARDDKGGAGLGLAICRSIVEAHGGTIWAEPAAGLRLRVCFTLPRAH